MKITTTLLFILLSVAAFGQEKVTSELNLNYGRISYGDTVARVRQFDFKISSSIYKNQKKRLSGSLSYSSEALSDFPASFGSSLQGLSIGLNWSDILSSRSALLIFGQAGIYSDMNHISSDAFRERLGFTYLTKHSDQFSLGVGLSYTRQFYGNQIIPIVAIMYHFNNEHWKLSGALPESPRLTYNLDKKNAISFQLKELFASYRLTGFGDSGNFVTVTKITSSINYEYTFVGSWRISAGLGYNMRQRYELYKDADANQWYFVGTALGDKANPIQAINHNGAQFHIGLAFNPAF